MSLAALLLVGCAAQPQVVLPTCDPDNGGLALPDGFCALVVADGIGRARHIDVTPAGDLYVHMRGARGRGEETPSSAIAALRVAMAMAERRPSSASQTSTGPVFSCGMDTSTSRRRRRCTDTR